MPRGPKQAKGLLIASIRDKNPVIFLEPKVLYRSGVGDVPEGDYELPLGQGDIVRQGDHITMVGWGTQVHVMNRAADMAAEHGISCELIDLQVSTTCYVFTSIPHMDPPRVDYQIRSSMIGLNSNRILGV